MIKPRVILADDYAPLLTALGRLIGQECEIVGRVETVVDLVEVAKVTRPDIAIVDMTMPDASGIDACRRLKEIQPEIGVIIVTAIDDVDVRKAALDAGAADYITKTMTHTRLLAAIREIWSRMNATI